MAIGKKAKIGIVIIIILIVIAIGLLFFLGLLSVPEQPAKLMNVKGDVQVGNSPLQPATEGMSLSKGSTVKTGPASSADILLFGSSVIRLDENTTVKISELSSDKSNRSVQLEDSAGRAWDKVLKVSGIDDYEAKTPTTVATIRGTGFWTGFDAATNISTVGVVEGHVLFATNLSSVTVNPEEEIKVNQGQLGKLDKFNLVHDNWVNGNVQKDAQFVLDIKAKIKQKYANLIALAKSQYHITDAQIDTYIDAYLSGQYTDEQIKALQDQLGVNIDLTF